MPNNDPYTHCPFDLMNYFVSKEQAPRKVPVIIIKAMYILKDLITFVIKIVGVI